jgi:predicted TIM-barrel fold metal-dependent hydrolase
MYRHYPPELVDAFQHNIDRDYAEFAKEGFSPSTYITALDRQGIEQAYLFPSLGLGVTAIEGQDPELSLALCQAYNDWISEFSGYAPTRLKPVGLISLNTVTNAITELRRLVLNLGFRAVAIRPNPVAGRPVGDEIYAPFWAACAEFDVSVALHESCHASLPAAGADRFKTHFSMHACCHPMEQMMAFVSLVEGGVFERHPKLRVAFLEAGCGWVPYLLWRMDYVEYPNWRSQVPQVKRLPSEYFHRQCFVGVEGCEPYLDSLVEHIGADKLLFATDFPHPDHRFGEELAEVMASSLSLDDKRKVLCENPKKFYGVT